MGQGVEEVTMQPSSNASKRYRSGSRETDYSNIKKGTQNNLKSELLSSKKQNGLNKRNFIISQRKDSSLKYKRGIEEKENKSSMESKGENKGYDLHADIERLQAQIMKTTMEINQLYGSYADAKSDQIKYNTHNNTKSNVAKGSKPAKKVNQGLCNEKIGKHCCESDEVMNLRGKLKLERSVRNEMIRILAREKLKNERKTKALRALVRYYHPDQNVLRQLKLPSRLKRVIIVERIKSLSADKQVEFARRAKQLGEKIQLQ